MAILNNLRNIILGILILILRSNMYGVAYNLSRIDTVRITYSHWGGGYAMHRSVACYVLHKNIYELQTDEYNAQDVPKIIHKETVTTLLNNCNQYSIEDRCSYLKITKEDYSNYIKILQDSIYNYMPYFQDSLKDLYKLTEEYYLLLSCNDIIQIIESSNNMFAYYKPQLKIEFVNVDHEIISLEPQWYFEGTAWNIKFCRKEMYIDYKQVISFLREIQLKEEYYLFAERFYLLFQIADNQRRLSQTGKPFVDKKFTIVYYQSRSAGWSASLSYLNPLLLYPHLSLERGGGVYIERGVSIPGDKDQGR